MQKSSSSVKKLFLMLVTAMMCSILFAGIAMAAEEKIVSMEEKAAGQWQYINVGDEIDPAAVVYHKFKVSKPSVLVIAGAANLSSESGSSPVQLWLCDSKKKSLERTTAGASVTLDNNGYSCYGVKKGTYYIKTKGMTGYVLAAGLQTVTDKGASSKSKAPTVKIKKEIVGLMPAGESYKKADWYKFKVTKKKKLRIKLSAAGKGKFKFYVYGPSYKKGILIDSMMNTGGTYNSIRKGTRITTKIKPGTYYLKVVRDTKKSNRKSSGIYSFKWQLF